MRPIIGGYVPPERVIGRDAFIERMWASLKDQSVLLVSERRIGKTTVIRKMAHQPPDGWQAIYMAIQSVRSPTEFVGRLVDSVRPLQTKSRQMLSGLESLYQQIAGQTVGDWTLPSLKAHWKRLLKAVLADLERNSPARILFLWDELPLMVSNIQEDHGPEIAQELLDTLRDHRLEYVPGKVRMVYTGSIGLHHVLDALSRHGYSNDPTNDMATFSLRGLSREDALHLAQQGVGGLVADGDMRVSGELGAIIEKIASLTDGIPFYLNHLILRLSETGRPIQVADVEVALESLLDDPDDPAHFRRYHQRIETYYRTEDDTQRIAKLILNDLSNAATLVAEDILLERLETWGPPPARERFQATLTLLESDHYLDRHRSDGTRRYQFRYEIIRRWWAANRA